MTIPVNRVKVMAFSFGAIVAALAGTIFAAQQGSVFPTNFQSPILILIYACLVLGGVGSIAGAVLGGVVVTVVAADARSPTDAGYLFYGLIIVALLVRCARGACSAACSRDRRLRLRRARDRRRDLASRGRRLARQRRLDRLGAAPLRDRAGATPMTYGNCCTSLLICMLIALVELKGIRRLVAVVPTVYVAACCWEARLTSSRRSPRRS